jgi:hypothetical protein
MLQNHTMMIPLFPTFSPLSSSTESFRAPIATRCSSYDAVERLWTADIVDGGVIAYE